MCYVAATPPGCRQLLPFQAALVSGVEGLLSSALTYASSIGKKNNADKVLKAVLLLIVLEIASHH